MRVIAYTTVFHYLAPNFDKQISGQRRDGGVSRVGLWVQMAMEYKIVIPPDMGGTQQCIECPPCQVVLTVYLYTFLKLHVHTQLSYLILSVP